MHIWKKAYVQSSSNFCRVYIDTLFSKNSLTSNMRQILELKCSYGRKEYVQSSSNIYHKHVQMHYSLNAIVHSSMHIIAPIFVTKRYLYLLAPI